MENVIVVGDFLGGCFPGFRVGGGFRAVACLYFFPQGKGILLFKQGLYFCLCFRSGVDVYKRQIQNVSDCPMLRDTLSLSKYRGLSARKSTQGKICFCGMISTKKAHAGEVERGVVTFPLVGFY